MAERPGAAAITRAVVVGAGSAGRRHLSALRAAAPGAELVVVRRPGSESPLEPLRRCGAVVVERIEDALAAGPVDVGVVASPAPAHVEGVTALAGAGATILLEKPVAASQEAAGPLRRLVADGAVVVVGYHLRWSDTVPALRALVADGAVGTVRGFELWSGQHLDLWRPMMPTHRSVSARDELGGGILLEMSHEVDGLRHLLADLAGEPESVAAALRFDGAPTDGVVETVADLDVVLAGGAAGSVHVDMVAPEHVRRWAVTGASGEVWADLLTGRIELRRGGHEPEVVVAAAAAGERDRAEARLVDHVLDCRAGRADPACTVEDGCAALAVVDAARESHRAGGVPRPIVRSGPRPGAEEEP